MKRVVQCRQMETVPHSFMPDVQSAAAVVYRLSDKNDVSAGFLNFKQCHQIPVWAHSQSTEFNGLWPVFSVRLYHFHLTSIPFTIQCACAGKFPAAYLFTRRNCVYVWMCYSEQIMNNFSRSTACQANRIFLSLTRSSFLLNSITPFMLSPVRMVCVCVAFLCFN